MPENTLNIV